jgi:hypothetical protein
MLERKKIKKYGERELDESKYNGMSIIELYAYLQQEEVKLIKTCTGNNFFDFQVTVKVGTDNGWYGESTCGTLTLCIACTRLETDHELQVRERRSISASRAAVLRESNKKVKIRVEELAELARLKTKYERG